MVFNSNTDSWYVVTASSNWISFFCGGRGQLQLDWQGFGIQLRVKTNYVIDIDRVSLSVSFLGTVVVKIIGFSFSILLQNQSYGSPLYSSYDVTIAHHARLGFRLWWSHDIA